MLLVTNIDLPSLLAVSNFRKTNFSVEITYDSLMGILTNQCKDVKSAEIYWSGSTGEICDLLSRQGIAPVANVNTIQSGMKILQVVNDNVAALIDIKYMRQ